MSTILYSDDVQEDQLRIEAAGGTITVPVFVFPSGRRFQFLDPDGHELAVWSDT